MKAIFVSDVHLRRRDENNYRFFMDFLSYLEMGSVPGHSGDQVNHLYLLGDIFDFWFARKEVIYPEYQPVLEKLKELKRRGVQIFYFEGNHDFFLREYFSHSIEAIVYEDWGDITIDGHRFLLAHGDLIDRQNRSYLMLRSLLRSRAFYLFQRILPLKFVWRIAGFSSDLGKEKRQSGEENLLNIMHSYALKCFAQGYDAAIFGHCHLPRLYSYHREEKNKVFAVLGDWLKYFTFVYYRDGRIDLKHMTGRNIGSGLLG
ncbi:MAG: UDP-2,3-diacylglucosamine diphosphatase [Syntrophales bacterium]|nr:UDP-2,3-diacylglucosamine diphosphatase [Syntrophales bacterium]